MMLFSTPNVLAVHSVNPASTAETIHAEEYAAASKKELKQLKREQRKLERQEKRAERKTDRAGKLLAKLYEKASRGDTSGIGLALAIILVGAVLAILGLVGVADLLISIGIIILVVGLVIWIFTSLT